MMTAGIHATRHLDVDLAQIVNIVVVVEALVDEPRDVDGARVRETAEVQTRTANDIGQGPDVGRGEPRALNGPPSLLPLSLPHIRAHPLLPIVHPPLPPP